MERVCYLCGQESLNITTRTTPDSLRYMTVLQDFCNLHYTCISLCELSKQTHSHSCDFLAINCKHSVVILQIVTFFSL